MRSNCSFIWQPDLKGKKAFSTTSLTGQVQKKLQEKQWDIRSWGREAYRPWLLSWKEVGSWQELKWRLGWDLPESSPFKKEDTVLVFLELGALCKISTILAEFLKRSWFSFSGSRRVLQPKAMYPRCFGKIFTRG